jgi:hypothetical protein
MPAKSKAKNIKLLSRTDYIRVSLVLGSRLDINNHKKEPLKHRVCQVPGSDLSLSGGLQREAMK